MKKLFVLLFLLPIAGFAQTQTFESNGYSQIPGFLSGPLNSALIDSSFTRCAGAVYCLGNGTPGDTTGTLNLKNIVATGSISAAQLSVSSAFQLNGVTIPANSTAANSPSFFLTFHSNNSGGTSLTGTISLDDNGNLLLNPASGQNVIATTFQGNLTGNANTATQLYLQPQDCGAGLYAVGIYANGDAICQSLPSGGGGSSIPYPGAGIPVSSGTAWLTSLPVPGNSISVLGTNSSGQFVQTQASSVATLLNATPQKLDLTSVAVGPQPDAVNIGPLSTMTSSWNLDTTTPATALQSVSGVSLTPTESQSISQPTGTGFYANTLDGQYIASQFQSPANTGNNGIANAISTGCKGAGCLIYVDPSYANTESIQGVAQDNYGFTFPQQTFVEDNRNGVLNLAFHSPASSNPPQLSGVRIRTDYDRFPNSMFSFSGFAGSEASLTFHTNFYTGMQNTENNFGNIPVYEYGGFHVGMRNVLNAFDSGQKFSTWETEGCYGTGDCINGYIQMVADGGTSGVDDEGVHYRDISVSEDPNVFTATLTGTPTTGATTLTTNCSAGCQTQGQDRLLIDTTASKTITGTFQVGVVPTVNQVPPGVIDPNAAYPVSTFVSLCYSGSDNGAGGTAGCPSGSAPSGYIPPQQSSPSERAPNSSIVTSVLASYPGQPSQFCTPTTLQSSNSAAACYMPASGVGALVDQGEYETVNYTYDSSTQQITLLNLRAPHLNGMVFAVGGLAGYAVESKADIYTASGTGGSGVQSQVFPVEGSLTPTELIYITQRTNEGYGTPVLGYSSDQTAIPGGQMSFSTTTYSYSVSGSTVTMGLYNPPNVIGCLNNYNLLTVSVTTANSTYNGNYQITQTGCTTFTYTLGTVSGTVPTSATVSFTNMQYTLYPAARVNSVYDTANNSVDGTFYLQPNTMPWASGDSVREPHYQKMNVTGTAPQITQFSPREYLGQAGEGVTYNGIGAGGIGDPFFVTLNVPSTFFLAHGGTHREATDMLGLYGTSTFTEQMSMPDTGLFYIPNCKSDIGCNSPLSNVELFNFPSLSNAVGGQNAQDLLIYDPAFNYSSNARLNGLMSGRYYFGNLPSGNCYDNCPNTELTFAKSYIEGGYLVADQTINSPVATVGALTTSTAYFTDRFTTAFAPNVSAQGTTGTTSYSYAVVAHTLGGGTSTLSSVTTITNGNATLSSTNYNFISTKNLAGQAERVNSYDVVKVVGSNYYLVGNVCDGCSINDTGATLSAYQVPASDTSNTSTFAGPVVVPALTDSSLSNVLVATNTSGLEQAATSALVASTLSSTPQPINVTTLSASTSVTAPLVSGQSAGSTTIASSATPALSATANVNYNVLTANVTSWTIPNGTADGQKTTIEWCENATGGFTVAGTPTNVTGYVAVPSGMAANTCNSQTGRWSAGLSEWVFGTVGSASVTDVQITFPALTVPANTCWGTAGTTTASTISMPGLTLSMAISIGDSGDPSAITGWGSNSGMEAHVWPSAAGVASYKMCNVTGASITTQAITFNLSAR